MDLDQFKTTYITESTELLAEMEERLLTLDSGDADLEEVNAIFRCAHSIKGGGGAFGLERLVAFTHRLEFLLDAMREGAISASQEIVDILLRSVDLVALFIEEANGGNAVEPGAEDSLAAELDRAAGENSAAVLEGETAAPIDTAVADQNHTNLSQEKNDGEHSGAKKYVIDFMAKRDLFVSGNEPLYLLRELKSMGNISFEIETDLLPALAEIHPEECYLKWHIHLKSEHSLDEVQEVFEFVEDSCDLTIILDDETANEHDWSANDEFGGIFEDTLNLMNLDSEDLHVAEPSKTPQEQSKNSAPIATTTSSKTKDTSAASSSKSSPKTASSSIRVDIEKVDRLVNMVGELVIVQAMIEQQTRSLPLDQFQGLINSVEELSHQMREMQESVMSVRMQPIKSVFARMPRIVRDLSKQLGKNIRLETIGENTEIDKTVIEQLNDPLTHMIRNSVDHGLETPEDRLAKGKPEQGVITLSADHSGGRIIIEITDDGNGINREKVLAKAQEKNIVSPEANLSPEEIDQLIFAPGFSTAEEVTDVSGRGVGMDVVRRNITDLGGEIQLVNHPGEGSRFIVSLPLTLAILDGMIIRVEDELYIIPISNIIETLSPEADAISSVADGGQVLNVRGDFIPITKLSSIFNIHTTEVKQSQRSLVILVESGHKRYGILVDELLGQQQVVIKSIAENSQEIEGVSGATILGDGNVSLILDIAKIYELSQHKTQRKKQAA